MAANVAENLTKALASKIAKPPLGTGQRFAQLQGKLSGARDPAALAAAIGRKKYGKARFQAMAKKGR